MDNSRYQALVNQAQQIGIAVNPGLTADALAALIGYANDLKSANQTAQDLQLQLNQLKISTSQQKPAKNIACTVLVVCTILIVLTISLNIYTRLSDEVTIELVKGIFWLLLSGLGIFFFAFYGEVLKEMLRAALRALPGSE